MADNKQFKDKDGVAFTSATDDIAGVDYARVKLIHGADGANDGDVSSANPLPVNTELPAAAALADNTANPTAPAVGSFGMLWDGATWDRAPGDSGNGLDVDVTRLPSATNAGATAKTADYDTGAGTDTVTMFGVALPASGGAVAGGTATAPLRTDPTGTTTQPVSGTVTANLGTIGGAATETTLATVTKEGAAVTGQSLEAGGSSVLGWLSSVRKAITDRLPAALVGGRLDVNVGASALPSGAATETTLASALTALQLIDDTVATDGIAAPTKGVMLAGTDGTNAQTLKVDAAGELQVDVLTMPTTTVQATNLDIRDLANATDSVTAHQGGSWSITVGAALPAGANNIGDVDVLTQPARARATDSIAAAVQTDALMSGLTALTPKFAAISASASGDTVVVAAVASKKIRVVSYMFQSAGAVDVRFRSGAATNLTGALPNAANTGAAAGFSPVGHFETVAGEALNINLSAAVAVGGHVAYVEV